MDVIRVVDVPDGTPADEAQRLLNVPCQENRYVLVQVFLLPNGDTRAFFRLASVAYDKKPGERGGFQANKDGKGEAAKALIKANIGLSVRHLVRALAQSGIKRGRTWVNEARMDEREGR